MLLGTVLNAGTDCYILDTDDMVLERHTLADVFKNRKMQKLIVNFKNSKLFPFEGSPFSMLGDSYNSDDFIYIIERSGTFETVKRILIWYKGRKFELHEEMNRIMVNKSILLPLFTLSSMSVLGVHGDSVIILFKSSSSWVSFKIMPNDDDSLWVYGVECERRKVIREAFKGRYI